MASFSTSGRNIMVGDDAAGYTQEEKAWLKKNWGDEYHFLRAYGLSIYKDEDREEGRRIVRGLMIADRRGNA